MPEKRWQLSESGATGGRDTTHNSTSNRKEILPAITATLPLTTIMVEYYIVA